MKALPKKNVVLNKPNLFKIVEALRNEENYFNMSVYHYEGEDDWEAIEGFEGNKVPPEQWPTCNTACCIAGWAETIASGGSKSVNGFDTFAEAREWLGLTDGQAFQLFIPSNLGERTREEAIAVINNLIDTGNVEWPEIEDVA